MSARFEIDKAAAWTIGLVGLVLFPAAAFYAVYLIFGSILAPEDGWPAWIYVFPFLFMSAVGLFFFIATAKELASALFVRFDDEGISWGKAATQRLPWEQVQSLVEKEYGVVHIQGQSQDQSQPRQLRVCTYLFGAREPLMRFIRKKLPPSARASQSVKAKS